MHVTNVTTVQFVHSYLNIIQYYLLLYYHYMTKNRQVSSSNLGLATAAISIIVQPTRQAGRVT